MPLGHVEVPLKVSILLLVPNPNSCRYQEITHSIYLARKPNLGLKACDGNQELLDFLRSDLIEVATRLQKGGLGYMEGTAEFEARVRVQGRTMNAAALEAHQGVTSRAGVLVPFGGVVHSICGSTS